ncbi:uncharacterized protein [Watersipora subatra]|uniref:uncharacterized protein n=1 Tax=Watersipora subatra TaxID=2589382 RepID=UPI00355AFF39
MQRIPNALRASAKAFRVQARRSYGHGEVKTWKEVDEMFKATMDHLPKPSGSWEAGYRAKSRIGNIAFGTSILVFIATLIWAEREGQFDLMVNPANWSDRQIKRQAEYYERGAKWRKVEEEDEEEEDDE